MQADVALHLMAKKPEQAQLALEAISRTSSEALEELRATLAVVRRTDAEAARAPAPRLWPGCRICDGEWPRRASTWKSISSVRSARCRPSST
ncbi:histidine kinase dimerization/phosphoacceptor domain-containing protein [Fodinicola feengrottensis]|uniref:histidine kinase dimerization/phosphoacceptor domain-containing protein n=1 Tax=Fodinicola feengrottensis TaxID=435914 RepID=UPI0036F22F42